VYGIIADRPQRGTGPFGARLLMPAAGRDRSHPVEGADSRRESDLFSINAGRGEGVET